MKSFGNSFIKKWNDSTKLGIIEEVFLSVPCCVGSDGIVSLVSQTLNEQEVNKLKESVRTLAEVQKDIVF